MKVSWDFHGVGTYWDNVSDGYCLPSEKGGNIWVKGSKFNHAYLRLTADPEKIATLIESTMLHSN